MKFQTLYLDMDGVLCDFHLDAVRAHLRAGLRIPKLDHYGTPLELQMEYLRDIWLHYAPGKSLQKWVLPQRSDESDEDWMARFWKPIATAAFVWENLEPYPWYKSMWELCNDYADYVEIVTTPGPIAACYAGKRKWIDKYLGPNTPAWLGSRKWALSRPGTLLIDDYDKTTARFASPQCGDSPIVQNGGCNWGYHPSHNDGPNDLRQGLINTFPHICHGQAITFPAPWNPYHKFCRDPLPYVEGVIKEMLNV